MSQAGILNTSGGPIPPGTVITLTGNSGGAVSPDGGGNINTVGTGSITVVGNPGTFTTTAQLTGLTNHSLLVGAGTATITNLGVATDGQLPIGSTGADPILANITSTGGTITVTNGPGTINLDLAGGSSAIDSIAVQAGTTPVVPTAAGLLTFNGATVIAGTNPVLTRGTGLNTMAVEVQISQALAATDATKIGLCNFDSAAFGVDANGFVTLTGGNYISLSPFIVGTDSHSGYSTIAAAIAAAVVAGATSTTPQTVYIKPKANGTSYSENLTFASGVNLVAFPGSQQQGLTKFYAAALDVTDSSVNITGTHTLPTGGNVRIKGITFNAAGTMFTGVNTPEIYFEDCSMVITTNPIFSLKTGATLYLKNCVVSTTTSWITYFNDSSTYNISISGCDIQETSAATTLGTNANVVYDISESNYRIYQIDATNAATFGFSLRDSYLINASAVVPFIIGAGTGTASQIPGIYFRGVTWNMTGLDSTNPMFTNGSSTYTITLEDSRLQGTGAVVLATAPFPTAGTNRYINCKIFFGSNGSFYVIDKYSGAFNGSPVYHGTASVSTANATATLIFGPTLQGGNGVLSFWGKVTGTKSDFSDILVAEFMAVGNRTGGGDIAILAPYINQITTSTATISLNADTASEAIQLKVAGIAATTYNWTTEFYFQFIPSST